MFEPNKLLSLSLNLIRVHNNARALPWIIHKCDGSKFICIYARNIPTLPWKKYPLFSRYSQQKYHCYGMFGTDTFLRDFSTLWFVRKHHSSIVAVKTRFPFISRLNFTKSLKKWKAFHFRSVKFYVVNAKLIAKTSFTRTM